MNLLFLTLISLGFLNPTPALADSIAPITYSTSTAEIIVEAYAVHYGIPYKPLYNTLMCESRLNPSVIGDFGTSYGIAQIHLPAHPDITKEEALNPFFGIDFSAREFAAGRAYEWTCYRQLQGKPAP